MQIQIDGTTVKAVPDSFRIEDAIEERSVLSFIVLDRTGRHFSKGQPVTVRDNDLNLIFSGWIERPIEQRRTPDGLVEHIVEVVDNHYLADKRLAARTYENQTAGAIAQDLITRYLAAEGVTAGTIDAGPTLVAVVLNYVPCSQALDALAERTGLIWYIDKSKALHFRERASVLAPWDVTDSTVQNDPRPTMERGQPKYRNRQYLRGGLSLTDPQTEQRIGDGNANAFTMSYPLAKTPTVTLNGGAQTVGIRGISTGKDWYWAKGDAVLSQDEAGTVLTSADTLAVTYEGQYSVIAMAEDPVGVDNRATVEGGGTGYVEWIDDDPHATSLDAAYEGASALLDRYSVLGRTVTFTTRTAGLEAGQVATITLSDLDVTAAKMLIESIEIATDKLGRLWYEVTATEGPVSGSWERFFGQAFGRAPIEDLLNVGGGDVLALLTRVSEEWGWTESVTTTVHACPVPSPDLFPAADLYPC